MIKHKGSRGKQHHIVVSSQGLCMLQCTSYIYSYIVELSKIPQIHVFCTFFSNFENIQTPDTQTTTSKIHYIIRFWSQTQVLQSLRHFISDHMREIESTKALMSWNKCLSKWAAFHNTVRGSTAGHICPCVQIEPNICHITCIGFIHFSPGG